MEPSITPPMPEQGPAESSFTPPEPPKPTFTPPPAPAAVISNTFVASPDMSALGSANASVSYEAPEFNGVKYLVMYAISLGLLISILSSIASLLEICFNYLGTKADSSLGSDYFSGYTLKALIWLVANLVVIVPVYVFLLLKVRKNQPDEMPKTTRRVRSLLYGVFMSFLGLFTLLSFVNFVYSIAVQMAPKEGSGQVAWWAGAAQSLIITLILAVTFWYQLKSFRRK